MNDDLLSDFENKETVVWYLTLYIAGRTTKSFDAISNLKKLCDEYLAGHYQIEIIDLMEQPHFAESEQIVATPTLIRKLPEPIRKIIGDLSNKEKVLFGLQLKPIQKN